MRQGVLFSILLTGICLFTVSAYATGGDMGGGDGSETYPYLIEDIDDFDEFAGDSAYWASGMHTKLMADIDLSGRTYTTAPVAPDTVNYPYEYTFDGVLFSGSFNGNGFKFTHLVIDGGDYNDFIGLFGKLGSSSEVYDLGIEDSDVSGRHYVAVLTGYTSGNISNCYSNTSSVEADVYGGSLVGENYLGYLYNCHSTGTVTGGSCVGGLMGTNMDGSLTYCSSKGTITGFRNVGGLLGEHYLSYYIAGRNAVLMNCYSNTTVNSKHDFIGGLVGRLFYGNIVNCYSHGYVYGAGYVGGLSGNNDGGTVTNCYSTVRVDSSHYSGGLVGSIYEGNLSNCYSTGRVTGDYTLGGLVGNKGLGCTITSCFWDKNTSGLTTSGGGTGKTTLQMKTLTTFTSAGWDFIGESVNGNNEIWRLCNNGNDYPHLNWESTDGDFACPDGINVEDLTYYTSYWLMNNCTSGNNYCAGADLNYSGIVDLSDFSIFAENWMSQ